MKRNFKEREGRARGMGGGREGAQSRIGHWGGREWVRERRGYVR